MDGSVKFRMLGPIELWSAGEQGELPPGKASGILAILLLSPGTIVSADTLIDRLWDTRLPAKARENLSAYVTRLRASLRRADSDCVQLTRRANGYVLDVDAETVDLHQFRSICRHARSLTSDSHRHTAVQLLRNADALWNGPPMAGLRGEWFARMRDSLEEERRAAIVQRVAYELELGRHVSLVGELGGLLAQYPLDEAFVACLMKALYQSGRTGDALSLYRETRNRLVEEQGTEPGLPLAELHQQILRHDLGLAFRPAQATVGDSSQPGVFPQATREPASVDSELAPTTEEHDADSEDFLTQRPGNTGKANLAVRVSRLTACHSSTTSVAKDDGQATAARAQHGHPPPFIELADARNPLASSPSSIGVGNERKSPGSMEFDNQQRSEIAIPFDVSYTALERGHRRFLRVLSLNPSPRVSPHAAASLTGSTLSQAGKALRALSDLGFLTREADGQYRFHDLVKGFAAVRATEEDSEFDRHQAIGRLLDYYLSSADEADRILCPFRRRVPAVNVSTFASFPAMTTREDAMGWLEWEWRNALVAARYAAAHQWQPHCADLTSRLIGFMEIKGYWDDAISASALALQTCRALDDAARIAQASIQLSAIFQQTGHYDTVASLAEDAALIYRSLADQRGLADALDHIGLVRQRSSQSQEALAYFQEALDLYTAAADCHGMATTLSHAGIACWHVGRYPDAISRMHDSLAIYREIGDERGEAKTLSNMGKIQLHGGNAEDALDNFNASLEIFTKIGGKLNQANLHHNLGDVYRSRATRQEALDAYYRALAIYRDLGALADEADVLKDIAAIFWSADCHDEALANYDAAKEIAEKIGNQFLQVVTLRAIADLHRESGRHSEALAGYHAALGLARQISDAYEEAKILQGIAETMLRSDDRQAARILFRQALDIFERLGVSESESARAQLRTAGDSA